MPGNGLFTTIIKIREIKEILLGDKNKWKYNFLPYSYCTLE